MLLALITMTVWESKVSQLIVVWKVGLSAPEFPILVQNVSCLLFLDGLWMSVFDNLYEVAAFSYNLLDTSELTSYECTAYFSDSLAHSRIHQAFQLIPSKIKNIIADCYYELL